MRFRVKGLAQSHAVHDRTQKRMWFLAPRFLLFLNNSMLSLCNRSSVFISIIYFLVSTKYNRAKTSLFIAIVDEVKR